MKTRVVDPHWFNADPDPDQDPNADPGPVPVQIQGLNDQKFKKIYSWEFFIYFFDQKLQFAYP